MKNKLIHFTLVFVFLASLFIIPSYVNASTISSPTITYPEYNQTVNKGDITVTWNQVANAKSYKFSLKDMTKFVNIIEDHVVSNNATSYTIPSSKLELNHLYKIIVTAVGSDSTEKYSESYFYVKKVQQLASFVIKSPASNSVLSLSDVSVVWDKVAQAQSYKFNLWDSKGSMIINKSTGSRSDFTIPKANLKAGEKYKIVVIASAPGYSDSKAESSFSIKGTTPPPSKTPQPTKQPQLSKAVVTNPKNNAELNKSSINVTWTPDKRATSFTFSLMDLTTNTLIVDRKSVNKPAYNIAASSLIEGHRYRFAICSLASGYKEVWTESYFSINNSQVQNVILERARKMCSLTWTPQNNLAGWKAKYTFKKGVTYKGIPYSQTEYQKNDASFSPLVKNKDFYSKYTRFDITMPKYGNDCSGFVSFCWGLGRNTTYTFFEGLRKTNKDFKHLWDKILQVGSYNVNNPSESDLKAAYKQLKPGDALLTYKNGHIMLYWKQDGDYFVFYEQTPNTSICPDQPYPTCRVIRRKITDLARQAYMPIRLKGN